MPLVDLTNESVPVSQAKNSGTLWPEISRSGARVGWITLGWNTEKNTCMKQGYVTSLQLLKVLKADGACHARERRPLCNAGVMKFSARLGQLA